MEPLISVILPVYKENVRWIEKSVSSILSQSFSSFELIIVLDDPDNIDAERFIREVSSKDSRVRSYKNNKNRGLIYNLNFMSKVSRGKYIARMDADDIAMPDRLEKQLKYLVEHRLDIVGSQMIVVDSEDKPVRMLAKTKPLVNSSDPSILFRTPAYHPTWLAKRDVILTLGYRNVYCAEDYDLLLRSLLKGYQVGNSQECLLYYRVNTGSISNEKSYDQMLMKERVISLFKKGRLIDEVPSCRPNVVCRKFHGVAHSLFIIFSKGRLKYAPLVIPIILLSSLYRRHFFRAILNR
ncbi:glycosyltransferase [Gallaecimonas sp. GXIMD4217]|uniref:glycosyltransferase n=1 Tax=Gallaecimonas sp. GXIMD4217 TaxID=3131927 RepID=UPI00311ADC64